MAVMKRAISCVNEAARGMKEVANKRNRAMTERREALFNADLVMKW